MSLGNWAVIIMGTSSSCPIVIRLLYVCCPIMKRTTRRFVTFLKLIGTRRVVARNKKACCGVQQAFPVLGDMINWLDSLKRDC